MKVLFDACVPRLLRVFLPDVTVRTAQEMGWGQLKNRLLLEKAEQQFDVFVTSDRNLRYQQKLTGRQLAILVLPTNDWATIKARAGEIGKKVAELKPGDFAELTWI